MGETVGGNQLNNILHLFSPLHEAATPIIVRDDYIIETETGSFRIAYSASTRTLALFYARHPDVFAATVGPQGQWDIAYKERLALVKMQKLYHDEDARWDDEDPRLQFDLNSIMRDATSFMRDTPRIHFREACLHRIDENNLASVFLAYHIVPSETVAGEYSVNISTKSTDHYRLFDNRRDNASAEGASSGIRSAFLWLGKQLVKRRFASEFPMRVMDGDQERRSFTGKETLELIETDFSKRQENMWLGHDPVQWEDQRIWPVLRASSKIRSEFNEFTEGVHNDPETFFRKLGLLMLRAAKDPLLFLDPLIDKIGEIGSKERLNHVPHEWQKIIGNHRHRFFWINSKMHENLIHPDPDQFGDLEWLSPTKHVLNFAHTSEQLSAAKPEGTFERWIQRLLLAPYDTAFEYRGDKHALLDPAKLKDIRTVQMYAASGVVLYYTPKDRNLFAYYHRPDHVIPNRRLPADAGQYLAADRVIKLHASDINSPMEYMPFEDFQNEMRKHTGNADLKLPSADEPQMEIGPVLSTGRKAFYEHQAHPS